MTNHSVFGHSGIEAGDIKCCRFGSCQLVMRSVICLSWFYVMYSLRTAINHHLWCGNKDGSFKMGRCDRYASKDYIVVTHHSYLGFLFFLKPEYEPASLKNKQNKQKTGWIREHSWGHTSPCGMSHDHSAIRSFLLRFILKKQKLPHLFNLNEASILSKG